MKPASELWDANLFGLPRLRGAGRVVDHFQTRQTALLFAYLVTYPHRHPRDEIVDILWPDADADSGRARLSQAIWRIRRILHELHPDSGRENLIADRNTVSIDPAQITSDVARFRESLRLAGQRDGAGRVEALEQAVVEYGDSGVFLAGFYDDWVLTERQRLLTDYLSALESLTTAYANMRDWRRSLAAAERAVAADPLLEDSHRALIRILAASGQAAAARRQYDNLARLLARELNTEPSAATLALMAQLREASNTAEEPPTDAPAPTAASPSNESTLQVAPPPAPLTTFYGRESYLRDIGALLDDPAIRLITLLGAGGVGKTRLALELARVARKRGEEPAAALVSLADIVEPRLIAESIALALTPPRNTPPMDRIANALTTARDAPPFLLVLDNAEHLAEPVGATAAELLARIPRLKILVTSQRSLGVGGEHEVMLTPLELPRARRDGSSSGVAAHADDDLESAPSVRLFIDRAKSVRPDFPTTSASFAEVARICERLEGLPLAIELCAGWAQTLGTRQMLEMLTRRFEMLVSRRTDIPARHRTLRAAIEYSYMLLPENMREVLVKLSIFRGGWTLAAAADVCMGGSVPATVAMLARLREHSLIVAEEGRAGDGMRYKMLESLRDFAIEQRTIAQERRHGEAHTAYFARFAQETAARMHGRDDSLWATRLNDEMENIRAALDSLISSGDIEPAWTVLAAVSKAWTAHGHARESHPWIIRALALGDALQNVEVSRSESIQRLRAQLLTTQAETLRVLSDFTASSASAEEALAIWRTLRDTKGMTECIGLMGVVAMLSDDFDRAQPLLAEALPLARALGDPSIIAQTLNDLGRIAMALQNWGTALERLTEGLQLRRRLGDMRLICSSLSNLGLVHRYQGDYAAARVLLWEAVSIQNQQGIVWYSSLDLNLASVERLDGRYSEALRLLESTIIRTRETGERRVVAWCLKEMGHLAVAVKQFSLGLRLLSCAETMRESIGMSFKPLGSRDIGRDRAEGEQALGAADAAANWTVGASADPEALLDQARATLAEYIVLTDNSSDAFV